MPPVEPTACFPCHQLQRDSWLRSCRDCGRKWSELRWREDGVGARSDREGPWSLTQLALAVVEVKVGRACRWEPAVSLEEEEQRLQKVGEKTTQS